MKKGISRAGRYERPDYSALFSRAQLAAVQTPERLRATRAQMERARHTRRGTPPEEIPVKDTQNDNLPPRQDRENLAVLDEMHKDTSGDILPFSQNVGTSEPAAG